MKTIDRLPKTFSLASLALGAAMLTAQAEVLHDNGETNGSATLSDTQMSSTLDDFYVPGAGWWIDRATTRGIWINNSSTVVDVQVAIWAHDHAEDEPDGDDVDLMTGEDFQVVATGNQVSGYDEYEITVDFDSAYLEGQEYYWIEFRVTDQFGHRDFHFMARENETFEPAHVRVGNALVSSNILDLDFVLEGQEVQISIPGGEIDPKFAGEDYGQEGIKLSRTYTALVNPATRMLSPYHYYQYQAILMSSTAR